MNVKWSSIDSYPSNSTSAALINYRPCPVCGETKSKPVIQIDNFQFFTDSSNKPKRTSIKQVMCTNCDCLYMNPVFSEWGYSILFSEAAASHGSNCKRITSQINWLNNALDLNQFDIFIDLGCHDGSFLQQIPNQLQRIGIDIDESAILKARAIDPNHNIRFYRADFTQALPVECKNTCILSLIHVLEHLAKPKELLKYLRTTINLDSILYIEVPFLERGKTNDINGFFSVTHFTHFSRKTLKECILSCGWEILNWEEQKDYNACRVLLKPNRRSESSIAPSSDDSQTLNKYLSHWKKQIDCVRSRVSSTIGVRKCIVWGAGLHTEFLYHLTPLFTSKTKYILVDSDVSKQNKSWRGITIYPPEIISTPELTNVPIAVSSYGHQLAICEIIADIRNSHNNIITLYDYIL